MSRHLKLLATIALTGLLCCAGSGCMLVPDRVVEPQFHNPYPQLHRVAVLPFTEDGREIVAHEFSDGLTDEMMLQLARLEGLGIDVVARASSLAFRGGACLARDIGATLRADYLLEGSVRRQGQRARIAAWLIETSGETQVWTGVYDRCLTDVLSVQTDVACLIADSLASELRPESRA